MEINMLVSFLSLTNPYSFYPELLIFMGDNTAYVICFVCLFVCLFFKEEVDAFIHLLTDVLLTRYDDRDYLVLPVWIILTFIQGHGCVRKQKLLHSLSGNLSVSLDEM